MRLYVWDEFVPIWSDGLAFAVAESESAAKDAIETATDGLYRPAGPAKVHDLHKPVAYAVTGCE